MIYSVTGSKFYEYSEWKEWNVNDGIVEVMEQNKMEWKAAGKHFWNINGNLFKGMEWNKLNIILN